MSRYIEVEAFMQNAEPVLTWDIIEALNKEPDADVVSRAQYNDVYMKNLELRAEILELKAANEKIMCSLHNMADCYEGD